MSTLDIISDLRVIREKIAGGWSVPLNSLDVLQSAAAELMRAAAREESLSPQEGAGEPAAFDAWIQAFEEDVVQGEYGYEAGEFTVYPDHWRQAWEDGLTPSAAFRRACEATTEARKAEEGLNAANALRIKAEDRAAIAEAKANDRTKALEEAQRCGIYVASRASIPERGQMWRDLRASGVPIISTWIDEDGPGETADFADLWQRIAREVTGAERLVAYLEPDDFPVRGVLIEIGMALAAGVPVYVVAPGVPLEGRSFRPLGSWLAHPLVRQVATLEAALSPVQAVKGDGHGG